MALQTFTFALSDAVLSAGASLIAAGGGLPQRVSGEAPVKIGSGIGNATSQIGGSYLSWSLTTDGGVVIADFPNGNVKRFNGLGVEVARVASASPLGMTYDPAAGEIYVVNYTTDKINVYDAQTLAFIRQWGVTGGGDGQLSSPALLAWRADTSELYVQDWNGSVNANKANRVQVFSGAGVWQRTIILARPAGISVNPLTLDVDANGIIASDTTNSFGQVFNESGVAVGNYAVTNTGQERYVTTTNEIYGATNFVVGGTLGAGKYYHFVGIPLHISSYDAATRAFERRLILGSAHAGGPQVATTESESLRSCLSRRGRWITFSANQATQGPGWRVTLGTQRARWSKTFASAVTWNGMAVPGRLGQTQDAASDLRPVRFYYSLDGGATRTEFTAGYLGSSIAIGAGATLTVDADINTEGMTAQIPPWIGGDAGEGPTLVYDDPAATVYVYATASTPGVTGALSTPATVIGKVG